MPNRGVVQPLGMQMRPIQPISTIQTGGPMQMMQPNINQLGYLQGNWNQPVNGMQGQFQQQQQYQFQQFQQPQQETQGFQPSNQQMPPPQYSQSQQQPQMPPVQKT
jgi:hypothetical protein